MKHLSLCEALRPMGRCRRLWLAPMHANWSICWGGPAWIFGNALLENCNSLMAAACWMPIFTTGKGKKKIGRAHVCTPVTNAHLVCRLLLERKKTKKRKHIEENMT